MQNCYELWQLAKKCPNGELSIINRSKLCLSNNCDNTKESACISWELNYLAAKAALEKLQHQAP